MPIAHLHSDTPRFGCSAATGACGGVQAALGAGVEAVLWDRSVWLSGPELSSVNSSLGLCDVPDAEDLTAKEKDLILPSQDSYLNRGSQRKTNLQGSEIILQCPRCCRKRAQGAEVENDGVGGQAGRSEAVAAPRQAGVACGEL